MEDTVANINVAAAHLYLIEYSQVKVSTGQPLPPIDKGTRAEPCQAEVTSIVSAKCRCFAQSTGCTTEQRIEESRKKSFLQGRLSVANVDGGVQ